MKNATRQSTRAGTTPPGETPPARKRRTTSPKPTTAKKRPRRVSLDEVTTNQDLQYKIWKQSQAEAEAVKVGPTAGELAAAGQDIALQKQLDRLRRRLINAANKPILKKLLTDFLVFDPNLVDKTKSPLHQLAQRIERSLSKHGRPVQIDPGRRQRIQNPLRAARALMLYVGRWLATNEDPPEVLAAFVLIHMPSQGDASVARIFNKIAERFRSARRRAKPNDVS